MACDNVPGSKECISRARGAWCAKDTVLSQQDLLSVLIEQLQAIQTNVVGITPTRQQLELENN